MINTKELVGSHDILFITLDSLRYDVACAALTEGLTPNLEAILPNNAWEKRQSPGNFTYAAHQAFFAGFLPTPDAPGTHERLFAAKFGGSESTGSKTYVFDTSDIVSGFATLGYKTICIGGVGFFNKQNPLGSVLPSLFGESFWSTEMGVTSANSSEQQMQLAKRLLNSAGPDERVFLFINVSALHQPNCIFQPGADRDSQNTQKMALAYVDSQLPILLETMKNRGSFLAIICSDHGTAYGEDGFVGHRNNHPVVTTVPYAECVIAGSRLASLEARTADV